ncbi:hypothetical protein CALCODRAFT_109669 [Calocera cornea HHB12733]|uniref:Secreted protein n=1 Tax=Calocera cornea HHB12733 TaxID=1353952 RepID=A0A165D351_9BASI|nr:hypothetical protein CALCODRAFT_109669 [Calocera cornea HHB12733]
MLLIPTRTARSLSLLLSLVLLRSQSNLFGISGRSLLLSLLRYHMFCSVSFAYMTASCPLDPRPSTVIPSLPCRASSPSSKHPFRVFRITVSLPLS